MKFSLFKSLAFFAALFIAAPCSHIRTLAADAALDSHAYPALGAAASRKVSVEWNRFYDHAGMGLILKRLHEAFPKLTKLYSLGKSVEGRELWCLEVTARNNGNPDRKPAIYIDGNIHGNEVQAGETVAYTAWYLCHQYGRLDRITALLDQRTFYLVPTINPDGRDHWFKSVHTPHSSRTGKKPLDNDRDGTADEDDFDDLDGDGAITQMRIRDPQGRLRAHPTYPEHLMVPVGPEERGEFRMLGFEGIDNDGDGAINEDGAGGYDMNRNWAWDWQPNYLQFGAHEYPFSLPETRAVAGFVLKHSNIAAFQSFHNAGGMILRPPGREGGEVQGSDDRLMALIAERGEKMLPFYRSMIIWKDLYTTWGGEIDWSYGARGILSYTCELWTSRNQFRGGNPSAEEEAFFIRNVLQNDGLVPWKPFDHPTYGKIEIGGMKKEWGRVPPSFLLEEECHRNMVFTLYHAEQMPLLNIRSVDLESIEDGLFKVWVTVENNRLIPTRIDQDVRHNISPPDLVSLEGRSVRVISAGHVLDPHFKRVEAVKRRPERVEVMTIPGMGSIRVQFIVEGSGTFKVQVDSAKGGVHQTEARLP